MKDMARRAVISPCGRFRYVLKRAWRTTESQRYELTFVMLNPSIADADIDDPTIRKCIGFAERNGYNELRVLNLFAFRATDPADLKAAGYPLGPENWSYFSEIQPGQPIVLAWGAQARGLGQPDVIIARLRSRGAVLFTLSRLTDGTPGHPLMLPYSCRLAPF